jgi:DNA-binding transcriptional regulator YbjK
MTKDRRDVIADAALGLIGSEGARALTHRAVDAAAGLPVGSTSYYCRKRSDLVALALRRHAELDRRALTSLDERLGNGGGSIADLASDLARELGRWIEGQSRERLAARFELFLACSRERTHSRAIEEQRAQFLKILAKRLRARNVARPASVAIALIALIEGLLLERVRAGRVVLNPRQLRQLVSSLINFSSE